MYNATKWLRPLSLFPCVSLSTSSLWDNIARSQSWSCWGITAAMLPHYEKGRVGSRLLHRLLGWRPSLLGWRPSLLGFLAMLHRSALSFSLWRFARPLHPTCQGERDGALSAWKRARSVFRGSTRVFPEVLPEEEASSHIDFGSCFVCAFFVTCKVYLHWYSY